jgi:rhamnosyltransferase subunit B
MKFAIVTLGSAGDLHPFLAIARALVERGHEVHLLTQAPYEGEVSAEGVGFIPVATEEEHERTLRHPLLWHPLHGFGVLWRHLAVPAIGPTVQALDALSARGGLTILASPLAIGARLAREHWPGRIRLLSGYTAPMGLRSTADPMFLGAWRVPSWMPEMGRRALWGALDRWKLEPMAQPVVRGWTERLGLPPLTGSLFGEALHPPWFAPVPSKWIQRGVRQAGFPIFEPARTKPPTSALMSFINEQRPFVVVYPGSADQRAESFIARVLPACRALGLRALLLSRFRPCANAEDADTLWIDSAPLDLVLPASSAFVHHGGIGSTAQAFAARTSQLVLASAYDQFENGARVEQLHQGRWLRAMHASPGSVHKSLQRLVADAGPTAVLETTLRPSELGRPNAATRLTCEMLEELHAS